MALVWLGTAAGRILIMHQDWKARAIRSTISWYTDAVDENWIIDGQFGLASSDLQPEAFADSLWTMGWFRSTRTSGPSPSYSLQQPWHSSSSPSFTCWSMFTSFGVALPSYILVIFNKLLQIIHHIMLGMNSILLYLGHEICSGMFPWSWRPYTQVQFKK